MRSNTGERPVNCEECCAAFSQNRYLKICVHSLMKDDLRVKSVALHSVKLLVASAFTGERPFKHEECSVAFSETGCLRTQAHPYW